MCRMEGNERKFACFDAINNGFTISGLNLSLPRMPSPNQDIAIIQDLGPNPFIGVILFNRAHLESRPHLEVTGEGVTEKVFISLLLPWLLFIPDHHTNICSTRN